jgi:hypothetical protein
MNGRSWNHLWRQGDILRQMHALIVGPKLFLVLIEGGSAVSGMGGIEPKTGISRRKDRKYAYLLVRGSQPFPTTRCKREGKRRLFGV